MKTFSRSDRVSEQIRRELAELLQYEIKDPRVGMVSLTDVQVTPDYAHAKVFYTSLATAEERQQIEQGLRRASGFLRRELGRRIRLHTLPELHFVFDRSLEQGANMSKLIEEALKISEQSEALSETLSDAGEDKDRAANDKPSF